MAGTSPAIDAPPFGMPERTIGPITNYAKQRRSRPHPTSDRWQGTPNQIIIPANDTTGINSISMGYEFRVCTPLHPE
jgi:hypothetical protein